MAELFKLAIPPCAGVEAGNITVTSPADKVYLLTFSSPPDNRLTTAFIQTFLFALDIIELRYPVGVVISTSAIAKFYSNGLNLDHVMATPGFYDDSMYKLQRRLCTYPMPTIALLNGHCFAGGLIISMCHDYRIMNPSKGYLCMNEIDFGAVMDSPFVQIYREKLIPTVFRDLLLEARRFTSQDGLKNGIIDGLGGLDEALEFIKARSLTKKGESRVYGPTKEEMYRYIIGFTDRHKENKRWRNTVDHERELARDAAKMRVEARENQNVKAKL